LHLFHKFRALNLTEEKLHSLTLAQLIYRVAYCL
jgi:hypothetical protein